MKMSELTTKGYDDKVVFLKYFYSLIGEKKYEENILKSYALKLKKYNVDTLIEKTGVGIDKAESQAEEDTYTAIGKALTKLMYEYYQQDQGTSNDIGEIYTMLTSNKKIIESSWYKNNADRIQENMILLIGMACHEGKSIIANEWNNDKGKEYYLIDRRRIKSSSLIEGREKFGDSVGDKIKIDDNFYVITVNRSI